MSSSSCNNATRVSRYDRGEKTKKPAHPDASQGIHPDASRPIDVRTDDWNPNHSAHSVRLRNSHRGSKPPHGCTGRIAKRAKPKSGLGDGADTEFQNCRCSALPK